MTTSNVERMREEKDIVARLQEEFDENAVCHCGDLCSKHSYATTEHGAVWNEDPHTKLIDDARHEIVRLSQRVAELEKQAEHMQSEYNAAIKKHGLQIVEIDRLEAERAVLVGEITSSRQLLTSRGSAQTFDLSEIYYAHTDIYRNSREKTNSLKIEGL